jgi:hypothetical protein
MAFISVQGEEARILERVGEGRWRLDNGTTVSGPDLKLQLRNPRRRVKPVVIEGLQQQAEFNGVSGSLISYRALEGKFLVNLGQGTKLLVLPENLRNPEGNRVIEPIEVGERHSSKLLRACWDFEAGETICEERPLIKSALVGQSRDCDLARVLSAFFELPPAQQVALLSLQASASVQTTDGDALHPAPVQCGAAAITTQLKRSGRVSIPAGQEGTAANFLEVFDANAFQVDEGSHAAIFVVLSRVNHSCAPNALRTEASGGRMRLVALRPIVAGEEICISCARRDRSASTAMPCGRAALCPLFHQR